MATSNDAAKAANGSVRHAGAIAKLSLDIDEAALKQVIRSGQLREFTAAAASLAAAHISAQIVDKIADMAVGGASSGVGATFVFDDGDFGTVPPRPKFGVGILREFHQLQRFATVNVEQAFG